MRRSRKIVVTGMGVVSPIGVGLEAFWESLLAGTSGVRIRDALKDEPWPLKLYSPVEDFDGKQWVRPRKSLKVMCKPIQFGYSAAVMAIEQAGLADSTMDPNRLGTVFGSETFFADPQEVASVFRQCVLDQNYDHDRWGEFAMREIQPLWMLKYLPNMVTSHISIAADARGPSNSICQGEASGILAVIEGADLILRGACDAVIVGGTGSQTSLSGMLYRGQHTMSKRCHAPEQACRPFDANRDGTVFGEGAGALVIESEEHAIDRGATAIARITDWSRSYCSLDSGDLSFQNALSNSLQSIGKNQNGLFGPLSHVNAHGLSCRRSDVDEAQSIKAVFDDLPVTALKSFFGHLGPGSGLVELIGSLIGLQKSQLPPTINYENADPACPVNIITAAATSEKSDVIKISFSNSGQIACLRVGKEG